MHRKSAQERIQPNHVWLAKTSLLVDRDWFSAAEWNTSYLAKVEDDQIYKNISKKCLSKFPDEMPCVEAHYEDTVEIISPDDESKEIDLKFDVVRSVEETASTYKLVLDLVSIQSVLFGLSVFGVLQTLGRFIQFKIRNENNRIVSFVIYLLCSIGASWHSSYILHSIVSSELAPTRYYELAQELQMPVMVFCDQIDQRLIDTNHKLTGYYLERLTKEMNASSMLEDVSYLNDLNEWTSFDLDRVKRFFYLGMKCFEVSTDQIYGQNQFHFTNDNQILRVNFTPTPEERFVYFMTKARKSAEFSKIIFLNYWWINGPKTRWPLSFSIAQEVSSYKFKDRFGFIRKHFRSFQEDDPRDLDGELLELQNNQHNLRTLSLPLREDDFGLELEEDLFEQFYSAEKRTNQNRLVNSKFEQAFYDNHFRHSQSGSDFVFNLVFLQMVVSSSNEENISKIVFGFLNVLFIWFDLGVLDMHPRFVHDYLLVYLYRHLPGLIFKKLKKFKFFLLKFFRIRNARPAAFGQSFNSNARRTVVRSS